MDLEKAAFGRLFSSPRTYRHTAQIPPPKMIGCGTAIGPREYLRTKPQHEKLTRADGSVEIVNHVAIRWLTPRLFEDLGLGVKLAIERKRAHARRMARKAGTAEQDARQHLLHYGLGDAVTRSQDANARPRSRRHAPTGPDVEQIELMRRAAAVKTQHPAWDRQACYAEAHRQLAIRPPG